MIALLFLAVRDNMLKTHGLAFKHNEYFYRMLRSLMSEFNVMQFIA